MERDIRAERLTAARATGTPARLEAEQFAAVEDLRARFDSLKIDVIGPVAITTGVFVRDCTVDGHPVSGRTRSTMVFVEHTDQWLSAHEHHSPFVASSWAAGRNVRRTDHVVAISVEVPGRRATGPFRTAHRPGAMAL